MQLSPTSLAPHRGLDTRRTTCRLGPLHTSCRSQLQQGRFHAQPWHVPSRQRCAVVLAAKRAAKAKGGWRFEDTGRAYRITVADMKVDVAHENAWQLAVPVLGVFGIAAVLGPLVITVAITGIAVSAALGLSFVAMTSVMLPLLLLAAFPLFMMGSFAFGMATLSFGLLLPKILGLGLTAVLGYWATRGLVTSKAGASTGSGASSDDEQWQDALPQARVNSFQAFRTKTDSSSTSDPASSSDLDALASQQELADFDAIIAEREAERRRAKRRKPTKL